MGFNTKLAEEVIPTISVIPDTMQQILDLRDDNNRAQHASCAVQVTMTEVNAAYNAFARTGAPPRPCPEFPELPLSYTDFAFWQRGRVQPGGGLESQVSPNGGLHSSVHLALLTDALACL